MNLDRIILCPFRTSLSFWQLFSVLVILAIGFPPCSIAREDNDTIGVVFEITGIWTLTNLTHKTKQIQQYDSVSEGAVIIPSAKDDRIVIKMSDRSEVVRAWGDKNDVPLHLAAQPSGPDFWSVQLWKSALDRFSENPQRYVATIGRGSAQLKDNFIQLSNGAADVSFVFSEQKTGPKRFTLKSIRESEVSSQALGPYSFNWNRDSPTLVELSEVHPGLYLLTLEGDDHDTTPKKAWVLLSSADNFAQREMTWKDAQAHVSKWSQEKIENPHSEQAFLRAFLYTLSVGEP